MDSEISVSHVHVTRIRRRQSLKHGRHLKARSNTVIHVTVRSSSNSSSIKKYGSRVGPIWTTVNTHQRQKKSENQSSFRTSVKSSKIAKSSVSVSKIPRREHSSTQVKDQTDVTMDHHKYSKQNKKKKCSRQCIILFVLATLIIIAIVAIILAILLVQLNRTATKNITTEPLLRWNTTGITIAGISNDSGVDDTHLNTPCDVVLDYQNSLYIADRNNHRIQKYVVGSSKGTTVAGQSNGTWGSTTNCLNRPTRVLVDINGNMYITDTSNHRILSWSHDSSSGTMVAGTGIAGSSNNQLYTPYGIKRDLNSGALYIADYTNNRIMSYLNGASSGNVVAGGNSSGTNNTQLMGPVGIHFDSLSNSLLIANLGAHNILRWVLGENTWTLLAGSINGTAGNTSTLLFAGIDVTLDPMGNMYVADRNNHRIQLFMIGRTDGITIAGVTSMPGQTATLLNTPWSVGLDNQLNLYVADANNHRIQKFLRY